MGEDAFLPSSENVIEGDTSIKVTRGGSMWNIVKDTQSMSGDIVGGSYMLYVPEGAELEYNYPRVWIEYVVDGITYIAARSPSNALEYPVETGWNMIPIIPEGVTVARNAERVNIMVEAPNIDVYKRPEDMLTRPMKPRVLWLRRKSKATAISILILRI